MPAEALELAAPSASRSKVAEGMLLRQAEHGRMLSEGSRKARCVDRSSNLDMGVVA